MHREHARDDHWTLMQLQEENEIQAARFLLLMKSGEILGGSSHAARRSRSGNTSTRMPTTSQPRRQIHFTTYNFVINQTGVISLHIK